MKNLLKVEGNIYGLGVYCFKDVSGKVLYVGSGMMNDRLQTHLYNLKRGLYENGNKNILQSTYNCGNLIFEVLHYSKNNSEYLNGTDKERQSIQESLEVLEQFYIDLYKDTVCNKMKKIHKFSTSPSKLTTYKRRNANRGINNPNAKRDENIIAEILWLKCNAKMKNKDIANHYDLPKQYVFRIGYDRWLSLTPIKPEWFIG